MVIKNSFLAIPGEWLRVAFGANQGDGIGTISEIAPEDVYRLTQNCQPLLLELETKAIGDHVIGAGSKIGGVGDKVSFEGVVTLISSKEAKVIDCVILAIGSSPGAYALVPTASIAFGADYVLTSCAFGTTAAANVLAQLISASFVSGTRLLTGKRTFAPVETLRPGDDLFTRDHGVQVIREIAKQTVRAEGQFAPITIDENALGSHGRLTLSPQHRLFVYDRSAVSLGQPPERLVQARHLLNGVTVTQNKGGFTDYFQVVLDDHEILFAEGIAVESQISLDIFSDKQSPLMSEKRRQRLVRQNAYARAITSPSGKASTLRPADIANGDGF
jgi:hypothetical protein